MCGITMWHTMTHHIKQVSLESRLGLHSLGFYLARRRLAWAGHVARMDFNTRLPRKFLTCWVNNPRPRGRPQAHYGHGLKIDLANAGIDASQWLVKAADLSVWRNIINADNVHVKKPSPSPPPPPSTPPPPPPPPPKSYAAVLMEQPPRISPVLPARSSPPLPPQTPARRAAPSTPPHSTCRRELWVPGLRRRDANTDASPYREYPVVVLTSIILLTTTPVSNRAVVTNQDSIGRSPTRCSPAGRVGAGVPRSPAAAALGQARGPGGPATQVPRRSSRLGMGNLAERAGGTRAWAGLGARVKAP